MASEQGTSRHGADAADQGIDPLVAALHEAIKAAPVFEELAHIGRLRKNKTVFLEGEFDLSLLASALVRNYSHLFRHCN